MCSLPHEQFNNLWLIWYALRVRPGGFGDNLGATVVTVAGEKVKHCIFPYRFNYLVNFFISVYNMVSTRYSIYNAYPIWYRTHLAQTHVVLIFCELLGNILGFVWAFNLILHAYSVLSSYVFFLLFVNYSTILTKPDTDCLESKRTPGGQFTEWWGDCGQSVVRASETGAFIVGLRQWVNFSATTTQLTLGSSENIEWFRWEFCVCDIQHIWIYGSRWLNSILVITSLCIEHIEEPKGMACAKKGG